MEIHADAKRAAGPPLTLDAMAEHSESRFDFGGRRNATASTLRYTSHFQSVPIS
jgi:hypothetical protein